MRNCRQIAVSVQFRFPEVSCQHPGRAGAAGSARRCGSVSSAPDTPGSWHGEQQMQKQHLFCLLQRRASRGTQSKAPEAGMAVTQRMQLQLLPRMPWISQHSPWAVVLVVLVPPCASGNTQIWETLPYHQPFPILPACSACVI